MENPALAAAVYFSPRLHHDKKVKKSHNQPIDSATIHWFIQNQGYGPEQQVGI